MTPQPWPEALERYSQQHPQEALRVELVQGDGDLDLVLIFRGFSSSLMRPTPADLSQPVIPPGAQFLQMDRLEAPFNPADPKLIEGSLDAEATRQLLLQAGLDPLGLGAEP